VLTTCVTWVTLDAFAETSVTFHEQTCKEAAVAVRTVPVSPTKRAIQALVAGHHLKLSATAGKLCELPLVLQLAIYLVRY
jgi:hypothetical protein